MIDFLQESFGKGPQGSADCRNILPPKAKDPGFHNLLRRPQRETEEEDEVWNVLGVAEGSYLKHFLFDWLLEDFRTQQNIRSFGKIVNLFTESRSAS